jgi:U3 small nucleolar RNA-associated protein 21
VTRCGNFALFGTASGGLYKANLQSRKFRGAIPRAHAGAVEGVASDIQERIAVTCGLDGWVRFWDLADMTTQVGAVEVGSPLGAMASHREGGLVAVAADDWCVRVIDMESRAVVREFRGHTNQVTALCFSGDCKWLVTASSDSSVRTWDIVSAQCIDGFQCPKPAVAVAFSPKNDMLATAHLDDVGVFLWSNRAHFANVYLKPFDAASMAQLSLPSVRADDNDFFVFEEPRDALPFGAARTGEPAGAAWAFLRELPPQNEGTLLQQSGETEAKFLSVIHVEDVKQRNRPQQAPSQGERAPFSLTTVPGAKTLEFAKPAAEPEAAAPAASRVLERVGLGGLLAEGPLSELLRNGSASGDWEPLAARLRASGPSAVDADIRLLSIERDGRELRQFVEFLLWMLEARREFDLVQGYTSSLLNAHGDTLSSQPLLKASLGRLAAVQTAVWREVNELFQRNECLCSLLTRIEPF